MPEGVRSMEGSGFTHVASLQSQLLVFEDGHRCEHSLEAESPVEGLFSRHGVQDDLFVFLRERNEFGYDLLAYTRALVTWQNRYVTDIGTVGSVRERPTSANQFSVFAREAAVAAVRENSVQTRGSLVSKRRGAIQRLEFKPVDAVERVRPRDCQRVLP